MRFAVSDLETEQVLTSGEATLPPNGLAELGCVPLEPAGNRYYLLELSCEGENLSQSLCQRRDTVLCKTI